MRLLWPQGSDRVLVSVVDATPPEAFKLKRDGHQALDASTTLRLRGGHMNEGAAMRTGSHRSHPTPNRRAALVSASAVTERVANGSHAFAYEGAPMGPAGRTIPDYRAQGNGRQTTGSPVPARALAVARAGARLFARRTRVRAELPPLPRLVGNPASGALAGIKEKDGNQMFTRRKRTSHGLDRIGSRIRGDAVVALVPERPQLGQRRSVPRWSGQLLCCAAAFLVALAFAGPAFASRAEVVNRELVYEADPGVHNHVTTEPADPGFIQIRDSGATIIPGDGCARVKGFGIHVTCRVSDVDSFSVGLGDLSDYFEVVEPLPAGVTSFVSGGEGDDELVGGPGVDNLFGKPGVDTLRGGPQNDNLEGDCSACPAYSDILDGGSGGDLLNGGPGKDYANYSSRSAGVSVGLDGTGLAGPWNDGEPGEGDNVLSNVEVVWGGSGDDWVTGNPSPNALDGGGANDTFNGGGGADEFVGGDGDLDRAWYVNRSAGVKVMLDDVANDGESGEGDNVHADVEAVWGGSGSDTLIGNAWVENQLRGLDGDDRLDGGERPCPDGQLCVAPATRPDLLHGGPGTGDIADYGSRDAALSVTLDGLWNDGEAGEQDRLATVENLVGGSGDDYISGDGSANRLTGGLGVDGLYGWGGPDYIDSRDWRSDYIYCGDGPAADEAFDDDIDEAPTGDCETRALLSSEVFAGP